MDRGLRAITDADDCRETITAAAADTARLAGAWPIPAGQAAVAAGIASRLSAELAGLRREWGHAYHVWWQAGEFHAMRRDNGAVCHCLDAGQLVSELQADLAALPVQI